MGFNYRFFRSKPNQCGLVLTQYGKGIIVNIIVEEFDLPAGEEKRQFLHIKSGLNCALLFLSLAFILDPGPRSGVNGFRSGATKMTSTRKSCALYPVC